MTQEIYFDNSSTTRVDNEAAQLALKVMTEDYGNPSSLHGKGVTAERMLKTARRRIATALFAEESEIIFTASGTEADNMAIQGIANAYKKRGKHIITSAAEHPAVLNACKILENQGFEITVLPVDEKGAINPLNLEKALRKDTVLVSLMLVNNEVGTIQPVKEAAKILQNRHPKPFFHVDAVQAFGKMVINPKQMGIDSLAASGHKIHAPKGVGVLYLRKGVRIIPLIGGGGQENNLRSGTENMPAVCAFGLATEKAVKNMEDNYKTVENVRTAFLNGLKELEGWQINGAENGLPHVLNIAFEGTKSEVLLHTLEEKGVYVSSGSACAAKKDALSPVLTAMGLERARAEGSLRFSFSALNTVREAETAASIVKESVCELRRILK